MAKKKAPRRKKPGIEDVEAVYNVEVQAEDCPGDLCAVLGQVLSALSELRMDQRVFAGQTIAKATAWPMEWKMAMPVDVNEEEKDEAGD